MQCMSFISKYKTVAYAWRNRWVHPHTASSESWRWSGVFCSLYAAGVFHLHNTSSVIRLWGNKSIGSSSTGAITERLFPWPWNKVLIFWRLDLLVNAWRDWSCDCFRIAISKRLQADSNASDLAWILCKQHIWNATPHTLYPNSASDCEIKKLINQ